MTTVTKLIKNKQPLPNVRFWDEEKIGSNIFFVPEAISPEEAYSSLEKFIGTQIKGYYQQVTVPGIISNFLGKKLANQKYYLKIKKDLPNFIYSRTPGKQMNPERTNIFDFSGITSDILSTAKSRSQKQVFIEFNKLITSVIKDYPEGRSNYLVIHGSSTIDSTSADFLNFLVYINKLNSGKIKTKLDGIVYVLDGKFFPIAVPDKEEGELKFLRNILGMIMMNKDKLATGGKISAKDLEDVVQDNGYQEARDKINDLVKDKGSDSIRVVQKDIKEIVHKLDISGTFEEKLETLYKDSSSKTGEKVEELKRKINKKYNGNVEVSIPKTGVFDAQEIVGMDELGNYNKQKTELTENMDSLIEDLIHGTLETDPDVEIKVLNIKTKIVDDNKNRYKEYQVKIQHKDFGLTTNKPYTVSFRVPVPVQGKYIKLGGNNYILINQLFPKPIQKIEPNLVRFYSHYSVASLKIKNTKLNSTNSFEDIENTFVQQLKSIGAIKLENLDNSTKDDLVAKYNIDDLSSFKYSKMTIKA